MDDLCPKTVSGLTVNADGCAESQLDDDNDGVDNMNDLCPNTVSGLMVNTNGCAENQLDDDNDGVNNADDLCPNTPEGERVDAKGCILFELSNDNYLIKTTGESCVSSNNGSISVSVKNLYTYTVTISSSNGYLKSNTFNSLSWSVGDLEAGNYKICFTIQSQPTYKKCFETQINEPKKFSAYSSVNTNKNVINISLKGSANYQVTLNQITLETSENQLELPLQKGLNRLHIKTDLECQGSYTEEIFVSEKILVYPNPTQNQLFIYVNGQDEQVTVSIHTILGRELYNQVHTLTHDRKINISMGHFLEGVYFLTVTAKNVKKIVKIIKK